jgi:hypothetical protein
VPSLALVFWRRDELSTRASVLLDGRCGGQAHPTTLFLAAVGWMGQKKEKCLKSDCRFWTRGPFPAFAAPEKSTAAPRIPDSGPPAPGSRRLAVDGPCNLMPQGRNDVHDPDPSRAGVSGIEP